MERLRKSDTDRVLFGVCGGIGRYFEVDPVLVRVGFIVLLFAGGSGLLLYVIMAIVMPGDEEVAQSTRTTEADDSERTAKRRQGLAALLIIGGTLALLANLGALSWLDWGVLWPLLLIALGAIIIAQRLRKTS